MEVVIAIYAVLFGIDIVFGVVLGYGSRRACGRPAFIGWAILAAIVLG